MWNWTVILMYQKNAFLSSGLKGVGLGKCGPPSFMGEEMANAWSELTGFVNYKLPLSGPH